VPTIEPSQPIWTVTLMLMLKLHIYLFLYALSPVTELRRLRHESRIVQVARMMISGMNLESSST